MKENGLVRFRQEGDEDADPVVLSTEDELDLQDPEVMENPFAAALAQHQRNLLLEEDQQDTKGQWCGNEFEGQKHHGERNAMGTGCVV